MTQTPYDKDIQSGPQRAIIESLNPFNMLAAWYYVLLTTIALLLVVLLLMDTWLLLQFAFVLVVVLIPYHQSAAVVFFLVLATLLFYERPANGSGLDFNPFIVSCTTLVFVAIADRFRVSWRSLGDGTIRGLWTSLLGIGESNNLPTHPSNQSMITPRLFGATLIKITISAIVVVTVSLLVLATVGEDPLAYSTIRLRPSELRAIAFGITALLIGIFVSHLFSAYFWRSLTHRQARLYLRTSISAWLTPDMRAIARRRIRLREKRLRKFK